MFKIKIGRKGNNNNNVNDYRVNYFLTILQKEWVKAHRYSSEANQ
jgi:hypothetical protein